MTINLGMKGLLCVLSGHQVQSSRCRVWRLLLEAGCLVSMMKCGEYELCCLQRETEALFFCKCMK